MTIEASRDVPSTAPDGAGSWYRVPNDRLPADGRVTSVVVGGRSLAMSRCGGRLGAPIQEGVGLSNTRERLQRRFGRAATLTLGAAADGHTEAVLRWPLAGDTTTPDAVRPEGAA